MKLAWSDRHLESALAAQRHMDKAVQDGRLEDYYKWRDIAEAYAHLAAQQREYESKASKL